MLFVVRFFDHPDQQAVRNRYLDDHIRWLDQHRETIRVAGSLRDDPDATPQGALWVVEADSKAEIAELMRSDPFWMHGLRDSYEILHWSKAFPEPTPV